MSAHFLYPGRRRRKWVSYTLIGCYYDTIVYAVYRFPVINGVALDHLSWLHKIVPAS